MSQHQDHRPFYETKTIDSKETSNSQDGTGRCNLGRQKRKSSKARKGQETRIKKSTIIRDRPAEESKRDRLKTNRYTNTDKCIARVATAWKKDIAHRILGELLTFRKKLKAADYFFKTVERNHKILTEDSAWWISQYCCKGYGLEVFLRTVDYGNG